MSDKQFFQFQLEQLKEKYPAFKSLQDYHLFTLLCIKKYFFTEPTTPFDQDFALDYLTDGANDGGIDAIFNDPLSDTNDVIIIQSKYYNSATLDDVDVLAELIKIEETINNLDKFKDQSYNKRMVSAYRKAKSEMEDEGQIRIYFFTSYQPSTKKVKTTNYKKYSQTFKNYGDFNIYYEEDIKTQIDSVDNGKTLVEEDKLRLDKRDNYLEYEDSIICNISAQSLHDLYHRRGNALLGLNLRYHIKGPTVDNGIKDTILNDSLNFWYKNNGILIVCESYDLNGADLKLKNFSIVNGGQTTNMIGKSDIVNDFYIQCKVIVAKGENDEKKHIFINSIAAATNTQKPIKKADLKANAYEQVQLKTKLKNEGVFYAAKKGEKPTQTYTMPYEITTLESVGKVSLAGVLMMPGSARSNSQRMYQDEYYYSIFKDGNPKFIKDLLRIDYYYERYKKSEMVKNLDARADQPMAGNGKTFTIACISFLSKLFQGTYTYEEVLNKLDDTDSLKTVLRRMQSVDRLIVSSIDNEEEVLNDIFVTISSDVLGYCYGNVLDRGLKEKNSKSASDYLKDDKTFYKDIIIRLNSIYHRNKDFRQKIDSIFKKKI